MRDSALYVKVALCFVAAVQCMYSQTRPPFADSMVVLRKWVPQFVDGGGWKTEIQVLNRRSSEVPAIFRFFKSQGQGWPVTTMNSYGPIQSAETVVVRIKAKGVVKLETLDTSSVVEQGFAYVEQQSSGDLDVIYTFRQRVAGRNDNEGTDIATYSLNKKSWGVFDVTQGFSTGCAIVNPSLRSQQYLLRILNSDGVQTHVFSLSLAPAEHLVFDLAQRFPMLLGTKGTFVIENVTLGLPGMFPNSFTAINIRFHPTGSFSVVPLLSFPD